MYTIIENVRIVISLLKQFDIKHIVISPGGTNIPVSQAVQDDPFFHCYSVPDERSAMYFAIGLYLQLGKPIATSCTSAQATRNYIPGLTEAFYKHVPILTITTSKLERHMYQDYMQAPDQTSLPKDAVKFSYDLPPITDDNTRSLCIRRTMEAMLEITHRNPGPVQLNLRINDADNGKFENVELPVIRPILRYMAWDSWYDVSLSGKKVLIVIGEHRPFNQEQIQAIEAFCTSYDVTVYVNNLSNYHGKYAVQGNLLVSCISSNVFESELKPDIFITIGGQTGDYPIYSILCSMGEETEHWRVCEDGNIVNTYSKLTKIFECPAEFFFNRMKISENIEHRYYEQWMLLNNKMDVDIELPLSNLYAAQQLYNSIPIYSFINFAILNSLRCWNYFALDPTIQCYSNVAAFGIDGCTSTLIGESMNTSELCFMITGDLAFFYDMNSLGIRQIKSNLRILLLNNNGGTEFKIMTSRWDKKPEIDGYISAAGHNGNAKGWAENCGFEYIVAKDKKEFNTLSEKFIKKSEKPIVFEVFTNSDDEILAINTLLGVNKILNSKDKHKSMVAKVIGKNGVNTIKKILGK